jgi:predicted short-subunit dehydrogenase-like oxidoreductase (DUF2520 family)
VSGALRDAGWSVDGPVGRDEDFEAAAEGADLVVLAVPDAAISSAAAHLTPTADRVVAHLAGSLGLDVLDPHPRRAALHPLVALPSPEVGARRLVGAWFAVAGDPLVRAVVDALRGRCVDVADERRGAYHAAAVVASNHLVALLGQAERIAATAGVPFEAYLDLVRGTIDNVAELGPAAALTGPAARGDWETIERHLAAIDDVEHDAYLAMVALARRLVAAPGDGPRGS